MAKHDLEFDPTDSDFEQFAREVVELDPNVTKLRGASNQAGDDGVYRNTATGGLITIEAKFNRQQTALPKKAIDNLNEASARNTETFGGSEEKLLFTTSGSVSLGGKKKLKQSVREGRPIKIIDFEAIRQIANDPATPEDLAAGLRACLAKKARRTSE